METNPNSSNELVTTYSYKLQRRYDMSDVNIIFNCQWTLDTHVGWAFKRPNFTKYYKVFFLLDPPFKNKNLNEGPKSP